MNIIKTLVSGLLIIPFTLFPNLLPADAELRGSTSYLDTDLYNIDWVTTFPPMNAIRDGIPGSHAYDGFVYALTVKNGFAGITSFTEDWYEYIDPSEQVLTPEEWDFLPENAPIPAYLTETRTADRVLRFENNSPKDWLVENVSVTVAEPEQLPEDSVHELHQIVTAGTVISEVIPDFVVPAGETVDFQIETQSPNIHTIFTNPNGDISGLAYKEQVNYSVYGVDYKFEDWASAGVDTFDTNTHTDPDLYLYKFDTNCYRENFPDDEGYFLGICGNIFVGGTGQLSFHTDPIPVIFDFSGRVITDSGEPMAGVEVVLEQSFNAYNFDEKYMNVIATGTTNADGYYEFTDLTDPESEYMSGWFKLTATTPEGWEIIQTADILFVEHEDITPSRSLTDTVMKTVKPPTHLIPPIINPPLEEPPVEEPPVEEPPVEEPPVVVPPVEEPPAEEEPPVVVPPYVEEPPYTEIPPVPVGDSSLAETGNNFNALLAGYVAVALMATGVIALFITAARGRRA